MSEGLLYSNFKCTIIFAITENWSLCDFIYIHPFLSIGHLPEAESFFEYSIGNTSYSAINSGYMDHLPSFTEDIIAGISAEIIQACMNDLKCVYDYAVTGNKEVGISTLNISMNNDALSKELGEHKKMRNTVS